jgi:hypothetical protein
MATRKFIRQGDQQDSIIQSPGLYHSGFNHSRIRDYSRSSNSILHHSTSSPLARHHRVPRRPGRRRAPTPEELRQATITPANRCLSLFQLPYLIFHLTGSDRPPSAVISVFSGTVCFSFICIPACPSPFLPSSSFLKYSSHSCIVISSLTDSFSFLSRYKYFHTSLCVLISFISFSSVSLLCFFFSL